MTYLGNFFITSGVLFVFLAGLGLIRMPSLMTRMQATSKAATLGIIFMIMGMVIRQPSLELALKGALIILFLLFTTPIATHAIALAAEKTNKQS